MSKSRRKFTAEERLSIVQEAEREGRTETIRKYSIAPSLFDRWRKKYFAEGINGLKAKYKKVDPQVKELADENERLKRIVANQALELEFKNELLKKNSLTIRRK
jgi:transposase-like protein